MKPVAEPRPESATSSLFIIGRMILCATFTINLPVCGKHSRPEKKSDHRFDRVLGLGVAVRAVPPAG